MVNWLISMSPLYRKQQQQLFDLKRKLHATQDDLVLEMKLRQKLNVFADTIRHTLSTRTNGTQLYSLRDNTLILITSHARQGKLDFYAFAPYSYRKEIGSIWTNSNDREQLSIQDILIDKEYRNKGVGSLLLKEIITEAEKRDFQKISGKMSLADTDNYDVLKHFYTKNGFNVMVNREEAKGSVEKMIKVRPVL